MRIYFVGSHATGKTTMTRFVSRRFGLPMITEVARAVLAELETNLDNLRTDMDLVADYQKRVFERQIQVEKLQGSGFVSDRAFDNLAYAAEHTLEVADMLDEETFKNYMQWVSQGIVFFVRPHKDLLKEDGVRAGVTWESVLRIDGMIKFMLEQFRVPYMPLESVSMQERARVIDFTLSRVHGLSALKPEESSPPRIVSLFAKNGTGSMLHTPEETKPAAKIMAPQNGSADGSARTKGSSKPARA